MNSLSVLKLSNFFKQKLTEFLLKIEHFVLLKVKEHFSLNMDPLFHLNVSIYMLSNIFK